MTCWWYISAEHCQLVGCGIIACVLIGCASSPGGTENAGDPAKQEAGGSSSVEVGGHTSPNDSSLVTTEDCGSEHCALGLGRCCAGSVCGQGLPPGENERGEPYFANPGDCVALAQGGAIDSACVASPPFCDDVGCVSFAGCRRSEGECGYWVEGTATSGNREERVELGFAFGCVSSALVR